MPLYFEPIRPVADVGPNTCGGLSASNHWRGVNERGIPPVTDGSLDSPLFWAFDDASKIETVRFEQKPGDAGEIVNLTLFLIQSTLGGSFDPASGLMEFPITIYKGDGTTVVATTTAHIANDADPVLPEQGPNGEIWVVTEYDLGAVSLDATDIGAGLVGKFDAGAPDGWVGGGTWYVFAAWLGASYSLDGPADVPSVVEGNATIRARVEGYSPIGACTGDSAIEQTVTGSSIFEQDT